MDLSGLLDDLTGRDLLRQILATVTRQEATMSSLSDSLARLSETVGTIRNDYEIRLGELQAALDAERTQDVADEQALSDAQARTDAALSEVQAAAGQVDQLTSQLTEVQNAAPDAGAGTGTDAGTTPDTTGTATTDAGGTPDVGTGTDAGTTPTPDSTTTPATDQPVVGTTADGGTPTGEQTP